MACVWPLKKASTSACLCLCSAIPISNTWTHCSVISFSNVSLGLRKTKSNCQIVNKWQLAKDMFGEERPLRAHTVSARPLDHLSACSSPDQARSGAPQMHPVEKKKQPFSYLAAHCMHTSCTVKSNKLRIVLNCNITVCRLSCCLPPLAASISSSLSSGPISSRAFWYLTNASPFCSSIVCNQKKKEHDEVKEFLWRDGVRCFRNCCCLDSLMPRQLFCSQGTSTLGSGPGWCNCNLASSRQDCQISWGWTGF